MLRPSNVVYNRSGIQRIAFFRSLLTAYGVHIPHRIEEWLQQLAIRSILCGADGKSRLKVRNVYCKCPQEDKRCELKHLGSGCSSGLSARGRWLYLHANTKPRRPNQLRGEGRPPVRPRSLQVRYMFTSERWPAFHLNKRNSKHDLRN